MANLSDASGTVTLTLPTKKDLKNFLFLHALSERHAEYHTIIIDRYGFEPTLKDYNSLDEIIENEMIEEDETDTSYKATFYFAAVGRWCFENNLNWFFDCLKIDYKEDFLKELKDNLKEKPLPPSLTLLTLNQVVPSLPTKKFLSPIKMVKPQSTSKKMTPATTPFKICLITTSMATTKSSQNAGLKKTTTVLQRALKQVTLNFITS